MYVLLEYVLYIVLSIVFYLPKTVCIYSMYVYKMIGPWCFSLYICMSMCIPTRYFPSDHHTKLRLLASELSFWCVSRQMMFCLFFALYSTIIEHRSIFSFTSSTELIVHPWLLDQERSSLNLEILSHKTRYDAPSPMSPPALRMFSRNVLCPMDQGSSGTLWHVSSLRHLFDNTTRV